MSKDINIHVKTKGTYEARQQLDSVGRTAEETGAKTSRAGDWIKKAFGAIVGPLGFAAIAAAASSAAVKVAKFFDDLKARCDEAVTHMAGVRTAYESLFEAKGAFGETARKGVLKDVAGLLLETGVAEQQGLPIIDAYTRQFEGLVRSGQLTSEQYRQGLVGMLGYGARHGGAATAELISMMAGWGMTTPEQQGAFRRQIAAGAGASGLTDEELITALGRGKSTIQAMGWTPAQAVETIALLAAGESGRKKMSLPSTTLQGLINTQLENAAKYGISEEIAQDPRQLLQQVGMMRQTMDQQAFSRMLVKIYGGEAAAGVSKLLSAQPGAVRAAITRAAGPEGIAQEVAEETARETTYEYRSAVTDALKRQHDLDITSDEEYNQLIREFGTAARARYRRRQPWRQELREWFVPEEYEKESAAKRAYLESLSPEEREEWEREFLLWNRTPWERASPREKYEMLARQGLTERTVNIHYHNENIYTPRVGTDERGPRFSQD